MLIIGRWIFRERLVFTEEENNYGRGNYDFYKAYTIIFHIDRFSKMNKDARFRSVDRKNAFEDWHLLGNLLQSKRVQSNENIPPSDQSDAV